MNLYKTIESYSRSKYLIHVLCAVSFAESSFFPIPPDVLLIPAIVVNKSNAYKYALYCSVSSVLGGILGYYIGMFLFDSVGKWLIETYNYGDQFATFTNGFNKYGFWIIALKGLTPIPYKLVTIASGFSNVNMATFIFASIIARTSRFFLLSFLSVKFGVKLSDLLKKHMWIFLIITFFVVVLGFYLFSLI